MKIGLLEWNDEGSPDLRIRVPYDLHCPGCGRYCKLVGLHPHYNGWFDLLTQTTNCKKCGVIDIELI